MARKSKVRYERWFSLEKDSRRLWTIVENIVVAHGPNVRHIKTDLGFEFESAQEAQDELDRVSYMLERNANDREEF